VTHVHYARTCIAVAALIVLPTYSLAAVANVPLEVPHAGSTCSFGLYQFGAIGNPILAGPDVQGPNGNEINGVQRVFFIVPGVRVGFAGWVAHSFDGRYAYSPAVSPLETTNTLIGGARIRVELDHPDRLPLAGWITQLADYAKDPLTDNLRAVVAAQTVATALSPCFAAPWDGKT
jgi:hypothetical protein